MKKFLLICVALIAFLATNASGGNQYQTDQLRTCIVQQSPHVMSAMLVNSEPAQTVYSYSQIQTMETTVQLLETDGWRAPKWKPSLLISESNFIFSCQGDNTILQTFQNNINFCNRKITSYNVDHSYGLRY